MSTPEIESISFTHTLYDFLSEVISNKKSLIQALNGNANQTVLIALNDLYIQNIKNPYLIAYIPEDNPKNVHKPKITEKAITAWFYHRGYVDGKVSFDEFKDYALITKEQFEKLRQSDLNLGLSEYNYKLIKEEKKSLISRLLNLNSS